MAVRMNQVTNRQIMNRFFTTKNDSQQKPVEKVDSNGASSTMQTDEPGPSTKVSTMSIAIIRNIPHQMHSKDLRKYFSDYTENGKFKCFHYRHRPEVQGLSTEASESADNVVAKKKSTTCCCVVSFHSPVLRSSFIRDYNGRNWMNSEGLEIRRRCFITAIKTVPSSEAGSSECMTDADARELIELRPPTVMPYGNVGTRSDYFLEQIRLCKLPASLIPKLGLKTGRRRRVFDSVPFKYGKTTWTGDGKVPIEDPQELEPQVWKNMPDDTLRREKEHQERIIQQDTIQDEADPLDPTDAALKREFGGGDNEAGPDDDTDQCEEWERHEALHDDVTEQDRAKPRKYEEEMEVVWEKGGPGLVWYTDKNYWDEREKGTDCDFLWADDWDVDYSVYYEGKSAGTKDARDAVEIQEDEERRKGKLNESVFTRKERREQTRKRRHSGSDAVDVEKFSKGIGSKLLGQMGWKKGEGLGKARQGRVDPVAYHLEEEGQAGSEKKGFGYHGQKLQRTGFQKVQTRHAIASCFDAATDKGTSDHKRVDPEDESSQILFRSAVVTRMKYRG